MTVAERLDSELDKLRPIPGTVAGFFTVRDVLLRWVRFGMRAEQPLYLTPPLRAAMEELGWVSPTPDCRDLFNSMLTPKGRRVVEALEVELALLEEGEG